MTKKTKKDKGEDVVTSAVEQPVVREWTGQWDPQPDVAATVDEALAAAEQVEPEKVSPILGPAGQWELPDGSQVHAAIEDPALVQGVVQMPEVTVPESSPSEYSSGWTSALAAVDVELAQAVARVDAGQALNLAAVHALRARVAALQP